jgi:hypothetical protein
MVLQIIASKYFEANMIYSRICNVVVTIVQTPNVKSMTLIVLATVVFAFVTEVKWIPSSEINTAQGKEDANVMKI